MLERGALLREKGTYKHAEQCSALPFLPAHQLHHANGITRTGGRFNFGCGGIFFNSALKQHGIGLGKRLNSGRIFLLHSGAPTISLSNSVCQNEL